MTDSLIFKLTTITDPLDLPALFQREAPLEIELGSGDGSFLVRHAALHPGHNFLGIERLLGRLRKIDRKAGRAGLLNLRLIRIEAAYLLDYLIPAATVTSLHVYFPDPWPKRRHRGNRLINAQFPGRAFRVLRPGGSVYLRTDDADYFAQMNDVFSADSRFQPVETPAVLSNVKTDFEEQFNRRGVPTLRAAFCRD